MEDPITSTVDTGVQGAEAERILEAGSTERPLGQLGLVGTEVVDAPLNTLDKLSQDTIREIDALRAKKELGPISPEDQKDLNRLLGKLLGLQDMALLEDNLSR